VKVEFPGADLLPAYDIGRVRDWRYLSGGMFLKPVLVTTGKGRYVLRAHRFRNTPEPFRFQAETLKHLAWEGIRCPQVIRTRDGALGHCLDRAFWALHQYLEGETYSWREWLRRRSEREFLERLANEVAKLHDALSRISPGGDADLPLSVPPIQFHLLERIHRQSVRDLEALACGSACCRRSCEALLACRAEIEQYWQILADAVESLRIGSLPRQIVHGDISPVNIVFDSRGELSLIDWDCLHVGWRLYDALGDVMNRPPSEVALFGEYDAGQVRKYVQAYRASSSREQSPEELACAPAFCLARQLEDLRQRMSVLPELAQSSDEEYAILIKGRVRMMRSICEHETGLSKKSSEDNPVTDVINLRSDTQTLPTEEMLEAMRAAQLGDDTYDEDPTVQKLESMAAAMLGKQAAMLVISGQMGNLAALMAHANPGDEVLLDLESHIFYYEVGSLANIAGLMPMPLHATDGMIEPDDLRASIRSRNLHYPVPRLLCLENTHNRSGGRAMPLKLHEELCAVAHEHGLAVHLDGARIFNAAVKFGIPAAKYAEHTDSVMFCLSKGLSCPLGSLLVGGKEFIERADRCRKRLGGGMRQAGVIAACGIVALKRMIDRLADDHCTAQALAHGLREIPGLRIALDTVDTNMVYVDHYGTGLSTAEVLARWKKAGVLASGRPPRHVRLVTHRHCDRATVAEAVCRIKISMERAA
jgi:threonine aldolase